MAKIEYDEGNVFAKILRGELPAHKVYEDEDTLAFMDVMPRASGHCLVIPKTPCRNVLDCDPAVWAAVTRTSQKMAQAVLTAFDADGVTLEQYNEPASGQTVYHLHVHVMPRVKDVPLRPHAAEMADQTVLAEQAERLRAVLSA